MLKVDLRKAFDTVRWDFVIATLRGINLPERYINWISECICSPTFSVSVNGVSGGFFKSKRGLRQGDSLSPFLFVLTMEVFSKLLSSRFNSGYIFHHPKTSGLNISHLMFADDVMIFFDGGSTSLHGINETLDDFAGWSGLTINRDKTELFLAGVDESEFVAISEYGFPRATLPIRYLGLPLMSRKLRIAEFAPLVDKIKGKMSSWAVKSLSFAGRLQLLSSVISGIVVFWISTFMLPKGCIREIESLCARFLWSGGIENHHKAKVAWSTVCLPKSEGGLGLRKFSEWNTALNLKLIWLLFSNSGSLWVAWHRFHHLSSYASNFCCSIGNGLSASFWCDSWTPFGPLIKYLGNDGPSGPRIPVGSKVAEAVVGNRWILPSPRSNNAVELHIFLTTLLLPLQPLVEDSYVWSMDKGTGNGFSSTETWNAIRHKEDEKSWVSSIWFKGVTPRNAFNMWVSHLDRLPTRSRMVFWGLQVSPVCCLCQLSDETRDHLLLTCDFSATMWLIVRQRLRTPTRAFQSWNDLIKWTQRRNISSPATLRKLVAHAIIYAIWKQRNNYIHNLQFIPAATVFKSIDREIINTINAKRYRKRFRSLMELWLH
ncbi:Reverse transcriptase domain [Arabidopsis thaliana x Arabidopsis arenosa]|uniref:Reverse transcriptase domain n=1 Tax=Arabidopsis thaliana x Arabidopsis arenosa TaxID=1240361 RepID=A0A8T2BY17_9BRAS|nr:Reverse transcriptase domain [Arabidopsis thaliana x Arabidopsis arenosa]